MPAYREERGVSFKGKVVLVTGAATGLGHAAALIFAQKGARVAVADVNLRGAEDRAREIQDAGGSAVAIHADISDESQVRGMVDATLEAFGRLDVAANNAATGGQPAPLAEHTAENWLRTIGINLSGTFYCLKYEIPAILAQGGGAIVNVASVAGVRGDYGMAAYTAAKHGVNGLTKVAAIEYASQGLRVNSLCPGGILTPMLEEHFKTYPDRRTQANLSTPMRRLASPEEMARSLVWLCSEDSSYINGHELIADGGTSASVLFTGIAT